MVNNENEIILPQPQTVQEFADYRDHDRIPGVVVRQTNTIIGLFHQGAIHNLGLARDYLHDYALPFLEMASKGTVSVYDRTGISSRVYDIEVNEASDVANSIFSYMPDLVRSSWVPKGFSKTGILRPPQTVRQFRGRVRELTVAITQIVSGEMKPRATLEAYPYLLRTFGFFKVGSELTIKLREDERKTDEMVREAFNDLLSGIDVSL